jgi:hypothetical protein
MMKTVRIILFIAGIPFFAYSQKYTPDDFYGTIRLEDNKILDFTFLKNPDGGTVIYYFTSLPDNQKFNANFNRKSLPLQSVRKLEFLTETVEETQYLQTYCKDCKPIYKAKVFYHDSVISPEIVYLAFDRFEWKSNTMKGFEEVRVMEARFIEEVTINVRK